MLSRALPLAISGVIVLADRITKVAVERSMTAFESIPVLPGWIRLIHTNNPGAAFGVLAEGNPVLRSIVLIGISALVLMFVASALWNRNGSFSGTWTRLGLSLILGGAIGNLYDRVVHGTVTDFIEVYRGTWSFPAFNVADSAITVGAIFLLIDLLRPRRKPLHESAELAHK
ncbi:MAG: signal peptidase II [Acidobacteriaceae bacterium]|nr:signal peptidase II [Acidobacteriaceae bacterium]